MDFVTHLPKTKNGYDALLVMVDYITKMMILRPTYRMATVVDTARLFVDSVVRAPGLPELSCLTGTQGLPITSGKRCTG